MEAAYERNHYKTKHEPGVTIFFAVFLFITFILVAVTRPATK